MGSHVLSWVSKEGLAEMDMPLIANQEHTGSSPVAFSKRVTQHGAGTAFQAVAVRLKGSIPFIRSKFRGIQAWGGLPKAGLGGSTPSSLANSVVFSYII
jgi:hypothetical protein